MNDKMLAYETIDYLIAKAIIEAAKEKGITIAQIMAQRIKWAVEDDCILFSY